MKKRYLISPGPTPVPEDVLLEMARPIMHHRTPQFSAVFAECADGLKKLFKTENTVITLASSGTGAMESSITNLFSPGETVLAVNGGKFGERWGLIAKTYGLNVEWIKVEWGQPVAVEAVKEAIEKNPDISAILTQGSETSTTTEHPIRELAALTKDTDRLLIVDGITAVGVIDMPMDDWGIDVLLTGSQKAMMLPPGLAFVALSDKAWKRNETARLPRFYFDLAKEKKNVAKDTSAYTPAVSLIHGLRKVLEMMFEEGLDNVYQRHDILAKAARAGCAALGLAPLSPVAPANSATGLFVPDGIDGAALVKDLRDNYGVTFAGGQDHLKGKIVRIAHLGYFDSFDIIIALGAIEMALSKHGHNVELGKGVGAAQAVLNDRYKG
ncbi:Serine--glyoxylate aminotransferase [hydrothermal vent metagenome]|uniref:Serine--glyoxylate aminotransferase n=1 Tax=hydrothermal vent metagenome TaxID=652676 RepID=A0A3B1BPG5_9ZZZZ